MRFRLGRRDVILSTGLLLTLPVAVRAQAVLRIGWLSSAPHQFIEDFRGRLQQLGYVEGGNLHIEYRYAEGDAARLPGMVDELVKARVNVLATSGSAATDAAVAAPRGVPIVFVTSDPMALGQTTTLARPGGVATGVSTMSVDLAPKKIEMISNAVSALRRLAIVHDASSGGIHQADLMSASATRVGIENRVFAMGGPAALVSGFTEIAAARSQAAIFVSSPFFAANARQLAETTVANRLPAMFDNPSFVQAGALMSYGADLRAAFRRQAELVHRVAQGGKLSEMPIEQATKFVLAFNQKTALSFGLKPSPLLMVAVDDLVD